ncbi:Pycsar system effector family protein [Acetobacter persici]|uniref:Pycsar system effector family protein n=1 Tax=Acetobacter persici TaxID=1076596 RepID=UPI0012FD80AF|nr:Pycsar system effector family protein [Acetobacter persici]
MTITEKLDGTYLKSSDMLKYSEAKNLSIIAINSAIFILYTTVFKFLYPETSLFLNSNFQKTSYFLAIAFIFLSSAFSLFAIIPKYVREKKYIGHKMNSLFYADISKMEENELLNIYKLYSQNETTYHKDLIKSILAISKIAVSKNNKFLFSCVASTLSIFLFFLFYINSIFHFFL